MHEKIMAMVLDCVRQIVEEPETVSADTHLFGAHGVLDSLGLVNLIADLEQRISEDFNQDVVLADDRAMSLRHSPFRTVNSLTAHIENLLTNEV